MAKARPVFGEREIILAPNLLDFYKTCHHFLYKSGITEVCTNMTARSGNHTNIPNGKTYMAGGAQSFVNSILVIEWNKFFDAPKEKAVYDYKRINGHGIGVECDTSHLEALHDLGYLPLEVRSLEEGTEVDYGIPFITVRSTHPDFFWLANAIETIQSNQVWPIQTSLTTATEYKRTIKEFADIDGTPEWLQALLGHDFSMRGMMGGKLDSGATLSGTGHCLSGLAGSDTLPVGFQLERDYGASLDPATPFTTMGSVFATEHSVQCSYNNNDLEYFNTCIDRVGDEAILSLVSDGYDFWELVTGILPQLKDKIMARAGKVVIRPDSGDPADVLCGIQVGTVSYDGDDYDMWRQSVKDDLHNSLSEQTPHGEDGYAISGYYSFNGDVYLCNYAPDWNRYDKQYYFIEEYGDQMTEEKVELTAIQKGLVEVLYDMFGGEEVGGFKFLHGSIGTIYGDSITLARQRDIYERLHAKGFAIANVVLGIGSFTYQYVTRDTHGSAVKATHIVLDGVDTPISKEVKGCEFKKSAKGFLWVGRGHDGKYVLEDNVSRERFEHVSNELSVIWKDGDWKKIITLEEVRANVAKAIG